MPFLEAHGLSKTYRNAEVPVEVFRNLDLTVERGEMQAIVGPSGIGKSTLLHLLGGLDRPDTGSRRILAMCASPRAFTAGVCSAVQAGPRRRKTM